MVSREPCSGYKNWCIGEHYGHTQSSTVTSRVRCIASLITTSTQESLVLPVKRMMGDSAGYECPTPEAQEVPVENMDTALNPLDGKIQTYVLFGCDAAGVIEASAAK